MDTTKEYIKMCDCPEIQVQVGEYDEHNYIHLGDDFGLGNLNDQVWLPRQDQLQEMIELVDGVNYHFQDLNRHFSDWIKRHDCRWMHCTASAEQLWLAFVMKEKYNKAWNGKEWAVNV